jgi:hypothetical protein
MLKSDGNQILFVQDIILLPLFIMVVLLVAFIIKNTRYRNVTEAKYFIPALGIKIIGGLAMGSVYLFYYGGGDTFYYYYDAKTFSDSIGQSFGLFLNLLFLPAKTITIDTYESTKWLVYFNDHSGWAAAKVFGILSILTFHSYPAMTVLIASLSFTGAWALYRTFTDLYPKLYKQFALAILFMPSVFFWGSGILKDSITFGCLGWMAYTAYLIFFKGRNIFWNSAVLFFTGYLAIMLKAYIVISFVPALLFWIFFTYRSKIQNQFIKVVSGPALFTIALLFAFLMVQLLGAEFSRYSLQNVMETAETFQSWHGYLAENANASGYTLGEFDGSLGSMITKIPAAVNVTLFRPYLWEVNNIVMLAAALESLLLLGFTLYILIRNGVGRTITSILTNPTVFFCLFFAIAFAFAVGFTTYNFGALVRYKIPCIPFFLAGLMILNLETTEKRIAASRERATRRSRSLEKAKRAHAIENTI